MTDLELIAEVARRTGLKLEDVRAVLSAEADVRRDDWIRSAAGPSGVAVNASVGTGPDAEVVELIGAATRHPLGLEFLLEGNLGAVASLFGVHAFTVEAARERLRGDAAGAGGARVSS